MKKKIWALGLVWLLLLGAAALADGGNWHESRIYGSVQLANYAGWCDGYQLSLIHILLAVMECRPFLSKRKLSPACTR